MPSTEGDDVNLVMPLISIFLSLRKVPKPKKVTIFGVGQTGLAEAAEVLERAVEPLTLKHGSHVIRVVRACSSSQREQKAAACC